MDDECSRLLAAATIEENIVETSNGILKDRRLKIRELAEIAKILVNRFTNFLRRHLGIEELSAQLLTGNELD